MLNLCVIVGAIFKMATAINCSMSVINLGHHLSTHISNFDDIGQCLIFAAILKMATARNFSMSGINLGHHNLPTYEMFLKSDNVEFLRYCGDHFENGDR
jgi:choline-glycine betaine transporter